MHAYIVQRILATVPVMAVVALFVFALLHLTPGDPAAVIAGELATVEDIARIRAQLGLDRPVHVQFVTWLGQLLQGDLGTSIFSKLPVSHLIAQRLEPTAMLSLATILFAVTFAVPMGVIAAWRAGSWIDRVVMGFAVLGFSIPVFVLGYLFIFIFAVELRWLPVQGYKPIGDGFWPFLQSIALPTLTLGVIYIALIARITRASVLEVLHEDYIRTARGQGARHARGAARPCAEGRGGADRHDHRRRRGAPDRRRGDHRERVRDPRASAASRSTPSCAATTRSSRA